MKNKNHNTIKKQVFATSVITMMVITAFLSQQEAYSAPLSSKQQQDREKKVTIVTPYSAAFSGATNRYIGISNEDLRNGLIGGGSSKQEAECVEYMMKALDRGCYNYTDSSVSVYADCANYSSTDLLDVIDTNFSFVVPYSEASKLYVKCKDYRSTAVNKFLVQKSIIEESARKNSTECVKAKNDLESAKKCYTSIMASSGSYFDTITGCDSVPGNQMKKAGKYGMSNIVEPMLNMLSGQYTDRAPNWREAIEAVLAGYTMQAKSACNEDYSPVAINRYTPDSQTNVFKEALTKSISNTLNQPLTQSSSSTSSSSSGGVVKDNYGIGSTDVSINRAMYSRSTNEYLGLGASTINNPTMTDAESTKEATNLDKNLNGGVFTISAESIPITKQRLEIIMANPSNYDSLNSIDISIAKNVYGGIVTTGNKALFTKYINDISSKLNVFIIQSPTGQDGANECSIYKSLSGQVVSVPPEVTLKSTKIKSYLTSCNSIKVY